MSIRTETLKKQHYHSASKLLAHAFYDNPAHEFICPNAHKRLDQLKWLLGANLNLQMKNGAESFSLIDGQKVVGMGYWTNPNNHINLFEKIKVGLLKAPLKLGMKSFLKMMTVSSHIENAIINLNLNQPHWYLNNMVVDKDLRGQGLGSKILDQEIQKIKAKQPHAVFSLTTQKDENVDFYKKHGFDVVLEENIENNFQNWIMCRA